MNTQDLLKEVYEEASEWTEMSDNPAEVLAGILANKLCNALNHIEYLERKIEHATRR